MSIKSLAIMVLTSAALVTPVAARAQARVDVSLTIFHDSLAADGDWVTSARFGDVWTPHHAHSTWRPYSDGYWTYTDAGWTWVSNESFGWATYHYGRWAFDDGLGWVWVPDTTWGPAWVAWRSSDDYTGWAPLAPGVVVSEDFDPAIDPFEYVFVPTAHLCDRTLVTFIEPPARNVTFVRLTTNATHFAFTGGIAINRGVQVERIEHVIGHAVPRLTVQATTHAGPSRVASGHVEIYRPDTVLTARVRTGQPVVPPSHVGAVESPARLAARQAQERRTFDSDQAKARAALEAQHKVELAKPPTGMTHDAVVARQETEHKAQAANEARQKQVMDARHAREQQHGRGGRGGV